MKYKLKAIYSGGQTGADYAGLVAARDLGIPTGGTAPKGWRICNFDGTDGTNPSLADFGLVEHESREYKPRTIQNVKDSDGTVWFGYQFSPGGILTIGTCKRLRKPVIINPLSDELLNWLTENDIKILNVSGNRLSKDNPTIYNDVYTRLVETFS